MTTTETNLATIRTTLTEAFKPIIDADAKRKAKAERINKLHQAIVRSFPDVSATIGGGSYHIGGGSFETFKGDVLIDLASVAEQGGLVEIDPGEFDDAVESFVTSKAGDELSSVGEVIVDRPGFEFAEGRTLLRYGFEVSSAN